jgi:hypothetical protein
VTDLPDYEILRGLGRGGMGVVYVARDRRLGREVAIKRLTLQGASDPEARLRFLRESEAVARLRHPGIVSVHAVGDEGGHPYYVMDLIDGESLAARLRTGPLASAQVAALGAALARALGHAHANGVLHRDLKPDNVLLRARDDAPLLTDFGLAKTHSEETERLTRTGEVLGTPAFMAPEQADGAGAHVDPAADVYGLGATLYAALTGRPPFRASSVLGTLKAVLTEDPVPPRQLAPVDPGLEAIVLRCLAKAPADRYPNAEALEEALRDWSPTRAPTPARTLARVAVALAALALLAWAVWARRDAGPPPPPAPTRPALAPSPEVSPSTAPPRQARRWWEVDRLQRLHFLPLSGAQEAVAEGDRLWVLGSTRLSVFDLRHLPPKLVAEEPVPLGACRGLRLGGARLFVRLDHERTWSLRSLEGLRSEALHTGALGHEIHSAVPIGPNRVAVGCLLANLGEEDVNAEDRKDLGQVLLLDPSTGAATPLAPTLRGNVEALAVSPAGSLLALGKHNVETSGHPGLVAWDPDGSVRALGGTAITGGTAAVWLDDSSFVVGQSIGAIERYHLPAKVGGSQWGDRELFVHEDADGLLGAASVAHLGGVRALQLLPGGRLLSLGGKRNLPGDDTLCLWRVRDRALLARRELEDRQGDLWRAHTVALEGRVLVLVLQGKGVALWGIPAASNADAGRAGG